METSPDVSKREKDVVQSECPIQGEAGLADALSLANPNANWGAEPNFNLNLNLTSPRTPRPATETSKLHGGNKKDNGIKGGGKPEAKGAVTTETGKSASTLATPVMSPRERDDPSRQKSRIPALSPTAEASVNRGGEQRLKSPNPKHTPTLSPKTHNMAASPKPQWAEQTLIAGSSRTTERVKAQVLRAESASVSNLNPHIALTTKTTNKITVGLRMQTNRKEDGGKEISLETQLPKTLHLPVSPRVHNQKGDSNVISPKLATRTPTVTAKIPKPDQPKSNEQTRHDSRTHSSGTPPVGPKTQNQRGEMALLSTKTPQPSSLSPKPSTQRKASGTKNTNSSGSKENLDSKDSSGSKTSSKSNSNSKATTVTKDSLDKTGSDSKAGPNTKTTMGSKDSLDSKNGSASKTSWGSKDSLDSKTGSSSKASPSPKSGMGSRDSLDSKTVTEIKASKTSSDFKTVASSKSGMGSKDDPDPKTQTPSNSKASFNLKTNPSFKTASELNLSSNSDVLSSFKPGPTHSTSKPSLVASGSKMDLVGSDSPLSFRTGLSGPKDNNLKAASTSAKPSPDAKAGSDSSKPEPVRSSSKSALADLSSSLTLSPRPRPSTARSPGSGPGKSLGSGPGGPNREVQRSPGSAQGNYIHRV